MHFDLSLSLPPLLSISLSLSHTLHLTLSIQFLLLWRANAVHWTITSYCFTNCFHQFYLLGWLSFIQLHISSTYPSAYHFLCPDRTTFLSTCFSNYSLWFSFSNISFSLLSHLIISEESYDKKYKCNWLLLQSRNRLNPSCQRIACFEAGQPIRGLIWSNKFLKKNENFNLVWFEFLWYQSNMHSFLDIGSIQ